MFLYFRAMTSALRRGHRLSEVVADELQAELLSARAAPGTRLPTEPELCERFGVGRSVIREAARLLVQRGLVTVRAGRGMVVADFSGDAMADQVMVTLQQSVGSFAQLLELRLVLEVEMSVLASERRSEQHLEAMRACIATSGAELSGDRQRFLKADLEFHLAVAHASGNPFFPVMVQAINVFLRRIYSAGTAYPSEAAHTVHEHQQMCEAIESRDVGQARLATEHHLRRILDHAVVLAPESLVLGTSLRRTDGLAAGNGPYPTP